VTTFADVSARSRRDRRSIRLAGYDYTQAGAYFVTVCTRDRALLFGDVVDGAIRLNQAGAAVDAAWHAILDHFPRISVDEFVVMPNHVHGILVFDDFRDGSAGVQHAAGVGGQHAAVVAAQHAAPLQGRDPQFGPQPSPSLPLHVTPGSLGAVVRSFKSAATKRINELCGAPGNAVWQRNYYDHVIRKEESLHRIRQYIRDNPAQWALDRENPAFVEVPCIAPGTDVTRADWEDR